MASESQFSVEAQKVFDAVLALEPQIRATADAIEAERCLPLTLIQAMKETGLFRMSFPRRYGGLELDLQSQIKIFEQLSRMDGSVGWCGAFGGLTGFLAGFLAPSAVQELFPDLDNTISAGQYAAQGQAEVVPGGFRVNGRWSFGSGCRHAKVMMGGCAIIENGAMRRMPNGEPEVRIILFPTSECTILLDTWHTTGLRGTGSHDYTVDNLFVPAEHSLTFFDRPRSEDSRSARSNAPSNLWLFSHVATPLGIARGAIDALVDIASKKIMTPGKRLLREEGQVQERVAEAEALLGGARSFCFDVLNDVTETTRNGNRLSPRQRALLRIAITHSHHAAKEVVAEMYDLAATTAIHQGGLLDRQMRDIITACQHRVVQQKMYRPAGRLLLGLESGDPLT
jgi:alkylation response protein AidB-like acyl-CoA dehydrogenase